MGMNSEARGEADLGLSGGSKPHRMNLKERDSPFSLSCFAKKISIQAVRLGGVFPPLLSPHGHTFSHFLLAGLLACRLAGWACWLAGWLACWLAGCRALFFLWDSALPVRYQCVTSALPSALPQCVTSRFHLEVAICSNNA